MKNTKDEQIVEFKIKDIELLGLRLIQPKQPLIDPTTFHYNISSELKINIENKLVNVVTNIEIFREDKETLLASLTVSCIFEIVNIDKFINKDTKQVVFPDITLITFNSISISTVRGIMYSQFKGTFLHNAILPIIDPTSFVKNSNQ